MWLIVFMAMSGALSLIGALSAQRELTSTQNKGDLRASAQIGGRAPADTPPDANHAAAQPKPTRHYLPYAEPTVVSLPTIGVMSELISVGKASDGSMEVPQAPNFDKAAWYRYSPAPGQYGSAIIVGHVDSYASKGASVFFNLAKLKPGDTIAVRRSDNRTAVFSVKAIREYHKHELPTDVIYAPVTENAELRLITCSGPFDKASGNYENNTVVFATLTGPAGN